MMMDVLFDTVTGKRKRRVHFHRFMLELHRRLKLLQQQRDPLMQVSREIGQDVALLCLDEFFVSDITDAMILGSLMEELFAQGVTLVATSNIVPDGLYKDGLQRARFLPAIALLNSCTEVVNVDNGVDYRLRALEQAELYHYPLDCEADASLRRSFESLVPDLASVSENEALIIENRPIQSLRVCEDVAWFEFRALCDGPRSQNDYIELGRVFHAVLIANVEQMNVAKDDMARRFINLVDEFYDRNVKLIISAEVPLKDLYAGGRLEFEFQRTLSRLLEMQSHEFLARPHKP